MLAAGTLLLCSSPLSAQDNPRPIVNSAQGFAVSAPLRELANLPAPSQFSFYPPPNAVWWRTPSSPVVDTVEQSGAGPASSFGVGLNFLGVGNGFPGYQVRANQPIPSLAVGDRQIIQWAKDSYAVFDKATGAALSSAISSSQLFQGFGMCALGSLGSGVAVWDKVAHRWLLAMNTPIPSTACVAVSTSADALGSYYLFSYPQGDLEARIPSWGVWSNGYYKSQNELQNGVLQGGRLCAYNRTKMLAGDPSAEEISFQLSPGDFNPEPADVDSIVPPPAGQDELFAGIWDSNHLSVYSVHAEFANPQNSFVTGNNGSQLIEVPAFTPACNGSYNGFCVPQKDVPQQLLVIGAALNSRIAYWDDNPLVSVKATPPKPLPTQHWYISHDTTASGGNEAPRWYEFTTLQKSVPVTSLKLFQSGTFAPDSNYRWAASIARDKKYDVLLGYSISSSAMYPSIAVTGRTLQDPLGTMEDEVTVVNGSGSQSQPGWGPWSAMRIDPDGCTFWYSNEYYLVTQPQNWSTQIVSAKFSNCN